jgi:hypothetical protein
MNDYRQPLHQPDTLATVTSHCRRTPSNGAMGEMPRFDVHPSTSVASILQAAIKSPTVDCGGDQGMARISETSKATLGAESGVS